jgi:hypothetical protein
MLFDRAWISACSAIFYRLDSLSKYDKSTLAYQQAALAHHNMEHYG